MISILQEIRNFAASQKIELIDFYQDFLKTIKGQDQIYQNLSEYKHIHTILYNKKKAGIVGYTSRGNDTNYFQIAIHQDYSGKGILEKAANLLAKTYNLNRLLATIDKTNIASIKAHRKAGFTDLPKQLEKFYRKKRKPGAIGLIKEY